MKERPKEPTPFDKIKNDFKFFSLVLPIESELSEPNPNNPHEALEISFGVMENRAIMADIDPSEESVTALLEAGGDSIIKFGQYANGVIKGNLGQDMSPQERITRVGDTLCALNDQLLQTLTHLEAAEYTTFSLDKMKERILQLTEQGEHIDTVELNTYAYSRVVRDNLVAFADSILSSH